MGGEWKLTNVEPYYRLDKEVFEEKESSETLGTLAERTVKVLSALLVLLGGSARLAPLLPEARTAPG